jgi:outer membrane receptor protein involved in Fe transport
MQFLLVSLLGVRLAFASLSDTLVTVVVSASRQPIERNRVAFPIFQAKVPSSQLPNTPELFRTVPGVFLQRTNQGGGSAFVRGLTGNQTLLVLDGIRFNNSTFRYGPNQYLNTIDPFSLDQVEVLRGSGAVQYGSDALSGVVHLSTSKPQFSQESRWAGHVLTRAISQGMETSALGKISYEAPKFSISVLAATKKFGDITRGGGGFQRPTGFDEQNILVHARQKLGQRIIWENLVQQNTQANVPVFHKVRLENFSLNEMTTQAYRRAFSRLTYQGTNALLDQVEFTASVQESVEKRSLQKKGSSTLRTENDAVQTLALIGQVKSRLSSTWTSSTGLESYMDAVQSTRLDQNGPKRVDLRGLYPNNARYSTLSAFSLHEWSLKDVQVHMGVRYQHIVADLPDTTVGQSKISIGALVYDAGLSYAVGRNLTVFASVASGFRAPNLDDLGSLGIVDFRYELPAYNLKPEVSWNKNVGIRVHSPVWKSELVFFHSNLTNLITRIKTADVIQNYPVFLKENSVEAYMWGFEWGQQIRLGNRWSMANQVSYVYGQNVSQNEPLRRIPPLFGHVSVTYQVKKVQTTMLWQGAARQNRLSAGDRADNRMNPQGTPGWGILSLQMAYQLNSHLRVAMQGENLGHVLYRMHGSGIDGIGRSLHVQIGYQW